MWEWVHTIIDFVAKSSPGRAIVFALVAGIMLTQFVKFQLPDWLTDKEHANRVRLFSAAITFGVCAALWPSDDHSMVRLIVAMVVGLASPTAYWLSVKVLYHYWPWLSDTLSARPEDGAKKP